MKRFHCPFPGLRTAALHLSVLTELQLQDGPEPNEPTVGFTQLLGINNSGVIAATIT